MNGQPLTGLRIGVFGKGGAGKSTLTVLLAHGLVQAGYDTVVLDADSTNLGLSGALGIESAPKPLMDHFGGLAFSGGRITCPVDDPTPLPDAELDLGKFSSAFQGRAPDGIRLLVGGKMGELGPGAGCDGPIAKIARDLHVRDGEERPLLLVDFKAGFEDSARGVLTSLDWMLVVVDPTTASLHMGAHLHGMWRKIRDGIPPATAHLEDPRMAELAIQQFKECRVQGVSAILNRVPDAETEAYVRGKLAALGGPPILGTLPEDPTLQRHWLKGEEVRSPGLSQRVRSLVLGLEAALARDAKMVVA